MNGNTQYSVGLIRYKEAIKEASAKKHPLWHACPRYFFVSFERYFTFKQFSSNNLILTLK